MKQEKMFQLEKLLRYSFRKTRQEIQAIIGEKVSHNEFIVLKFLWTAGPQKAISISRELQVSASHITNVTESLVQKGYIIRRRVENDRRIVEMGLTSEGETLITQLEKKKSDFLLSKFKHFSEDELDELIRLFKKISE